MPFITIRGFLGKDPKVQNDHEKNKITTRVGLAYTYQRKTDTQPEITEWYNLRASGPLTENGTGLAERLAEQCKQGDMIEVTGRLFKFIPEAGSESLHGIDVQDFCIVKHEKREAPQAP